MFSAAVKRIADEVLEDDADMGAQILDGEVPEVDAVDQDAALVGIVEPGQQLDDGGLAGAVLADQRQRLAGLQREVQAAHRPALGVGIAEADILEDDALSRIGCGKGLGSGDSAIVGLMSKKENRSSR